MTRHTMEKLESVTIGDLVVNVKPGFAAGERDTDGVVQVRMNNVPAWMGASIFSM